MSIAIFHRLVIKRVDFDQPMYRYNDDSGSVVGCDHMSAQRRALCRRVFEALCLRDELCGEATSSNCHTAISARLLFSAFAAENLPSVQLGRSTEGEVFEVFSNEMRKLGDSSGMIPLTQVPTPFP